MMMRTELSRVAVARTRRASLQLAVAIAVVAAAAVVSGCASELDSPGDDPGVNLTQGALSDGFTNAVVGTNSAIAVASDRALVVWVADATTGTQIVGQLFDTLTRGAIGPSRVYTTNTHRKWHPRVSVAGATFLIVYEDEFNPTDRDILGLRVGIDGVLLSSFNVDFSGAFDTWPEVVYAPQVGKFLVAYVRTSPFPNTGFENSLLARYAAPGGVVDAPFTLQSAPGSSPYNPPRMAAGPASILVAYQDVGGTFTKMVFATSPANSMTVTAAQLKVRDGSSPSVAYNTTSDRFAMAWREQGVGGNGIIRLQTLPSNCSLNACAGPTRDMLAAGGSLTLVGGPSLAPLAGGFVSTAMVNGPSFNNNGIQMGAFRTDSAGVLIGSPRFDLAPACPSQSFNPGEQAAGGNSQMAMTIFTPRCAGVPSIFGARFDSAANMTTFSIADPGRFSYPEAFDAGDNRLYLADLDWMGGNYKAECAARDYMFGLSATAIGMNPKLLAHSGLCVGPLGADRIRGTTRHIYRTAGAGERGDTSTGNWDAGFTIAECGVAEAITGLAQTTDLRMSAILCADTEFISSNTASCTKLLFSHVSDNRLNFATGDWAVGYSKNECGPRQIMKGVSSDPATGEVHAVLCCVEAFH